MLQINLIFSYFNPRSREGSDVKQIIIVMNHHLFQSTLPRGERLYTNKEYYDKL